MGENKKTFGGNRFLVWYGKTIGLISTYLQNKSNEYMNKGGKTVVSNPSCKFFNPFTLIINFTVDNTIKYQLIQQGDYKARYKKWRDIVDFNNSLIKKYDDELKSDKDTKLQLTPPVLEDESPLTNDEMFSIILSSRKSWFKKI